jgi:damage-control phosphatase, subfamily I
MHQSLDCIPCFIRQSLDVARYCTDDPEVHEEVLRHSLRLLAEHDFGSPSLKTAQDVHRMIRNCISKDDPYIEGKRLFNREMLDRLPGYRQVVAESENSWSTAARIAIAGNTIDFAFRTDLTASCAEDAIESALHAELHGNWNLSQLKEDVDQAKRILFLADNAGELVCDRLWLEQFPLERTTVAVKGGPILNDALLEDAEAAGLPEMVQVIENGSDAPGTLLDDCSPEFLAAYEAADMIVAKGMANFESLLYERRDICFLFKVKCGVVSRLVDAPLGSLMIRRNSKENAY